MHYYDLIDYTYVLYSVHNISLSTPASPAGFDYAARLHNIKLMLLLNWGWRANPQV